MTPIATCKRGTCQGCPVQDGVQCHFSKSDLAAFLGLFLLAAMVGGIGMWRAGPWSLILWIGFAGLFFGLLEIRVLCTHCPHYAESGHTLTCWANYGMPKLWRFRPGPMERWEKVTLLGGFAFLALFPLIVLLFSRQWLFAGGFQLLASWFALGHLYGKLCKVCMNFACPLNRVPTSVRQTFLEQNPVMAEAWNAYRRVKRSV